MLKKVEIKENTVEYKFKPWLMKDYLDNDRLLNQAGVKTPKVLDVRDNVVVTEKIDSQLVDDVLLLEDLQRKINSVKFRKTFDEEAVLTRLPDCSFVDKIVGDDVGTHFDFSVVNVFADMTVIDFQDSRMAPREFDYTYRYFNPYQYRDVEGFESFCDLHELNFEKCLFMEKFICEFVIHWRKETPQLKRYLSYVNDRLHLSH